MNGIPSDSGQNSTTNSITINSVRLTWGTPTTYSDGTVIGQGDIKGYIIYYSVIPGVYTTINKIFVTAPVSNATNNNIDNFAPGTYYFVVTAVDVSDTESDYSNEVSKVIN